MPTVFGAEQFNPPRPQTKSISSPGTPSPAHAFWQLDDVRSLASHGIPRTSPCAEHADEFCEDCAEQHAPTLQIRQTLQRVGTKLVLVPPKTDRSERVMPLPLLVAWALVDHWDLQDDEAEAADDKWEESGLIFTTITGGPIDPTYLRSNWYPIRKHAGLDDVRFHDIQHSCVTLLLRLGVPPHIIRVIVGHSNIEVTMMIYAAVSLEGKRDALRRLTDELR